MRHIHRRYTTPEQIPALATAPQLMPLVKAGWLRLVVWKEALPPGRGESNEGEEFTDPEGVAGGR
jgi:hypothetical protein